MLHTDLSSRSRASERHRTPRCRQGLQALPVLALGLLLGACATLFNDPINVQATPDDTKAIPVGLPDVGGDTVVALSFSGGGTRAAAFAHGVMRGLDRLPAAAGGTYFDKVVFMSGVSG